MNRFRCPLFADWLERNNMNCFFRYIMLCHIMSYHYIMKAHITNVTWNITKMDMTQIPHTTKLNAKQGALKPVQTMCFQLVIIKSNYWSWQIKMLPGQVKLIGTMVWLLESHSYFSTALWVCSHGVFSFGRKYVNWEIHLYISGD